MGRYTELNYSNFSFEMLMMCFSEVNVRGTNEYVFERSVFNSPVNEDRFVVRIYSSIQKDTNVSRNMGRDAIRIMIYDSVLKQTVKMKQRRVNRTENAMENMKERAREAWGYVLRPEHHCPLCGSLMILRIASPKNQKYSGGQRQSRKFLGCSGYPKCKHTRNFPNEE